MSYAAILVHVQGDDRARPRLDHAIALAKRFGATLIGLAAEMTPPVAPNDGYFALQGGWFEAIETHLQANQKRAREIFEKAVAGLTPTPVWETAFQRPVEAMALASRAADLIVCSLAQDGRADSYYDASPGRLVVTSGRPVLLTPPTAKPLLGSRVLVAWKDTREARRALNDALPFLKAAKQVLVVEFCAKDEAGEAVIRTDDVASALGRHGVSAAGKVVSAGAAGRGLLEEADAYGADLIVAGAYGHSRLGEWAFGGVTRALMSQDVCHVLLSH